jgi:hypothetical protein
VLSAFSILALAVALYFLWGLIDPATQYETEKRWAGEKATLETAKFYESSTNFRVRNAVGFVTSLALCVLSLLGGGETPTRSADGSSRRADQRAILEDRQHVDDALEKEAEKGDLYYRYYRDQPAGSRTPPARPAGSF